MLNSTGDRSLSLCELRSLLPSHLFQRNSARSVAVLLRDLTMAVALAFLVTAGDAALTSFQHSSTLGLVGRVCIWLA